MPQRGSPLVLHPSPLAGEGGARRVAAGGRGGLRDYARDLRRNQTEAEKALWLIFRAKRFAGWKWRRQLPIGPYIVDFACPAARLIVEADGGQHAGDADARRDNWLTVQGWLILRFWNTEILTNIDGVVATIAVALPPLPPVAARRAPPSPARGEGSEGRPAHA